MGVVDTKGSHLLAEGKLKEAIASFKLDLSSEDEILKSNAYYELAIIYKKKADKSFLIRKLYRNKYKSFLLDAASIQFCLPVCEYEYAQYLSDLGETDEALNHINSAITKHTALFGNDDFSEQSKIIVEKKELGWFLFTKAKLLQELGLFDEAVPVLFEALKLANEVSDVNLQVIILNTIMIIHLIRLDFKAAKELAKNVIFIETKSDQIIMIKNQYLAFIPILENSDIPSPDGAMNPIIVFHERSFNRINAAKTIGELREVRSYLLGDGLVSVKQNINPLLNVTLTYINSKKKFIQTELDTLRSGREIQKSPSLYHSLNTMTLRNLRKMKTLLLSLLKKGRTLILNISGDAKSRSSREKYQSVEEEFAELKRGMEKHLRIVNDLVFSNLEMTYNISLSLLQYNERQLSRLINKGYHASPFNRLSWFFFELEHFRRTSSIDLKSILSWDSNIHRYSSGIILRGWILGTSLDRSAFFPQIQSQPSFLTRGFG